MERDSYSIGEIILGLRDEYQKNQEELKALKSCVATSDKRVKDFNFKIFQYYFGGKKPELQLDFIENRNQLQQLLDIILKKTGLYIEGKKQAQCYKNNNDEYIILGNFRAYVKANQVKEFSEQAERILNSEFNLGIHSNYIEISNSEIDATLDIEQRYIEFFINKGKHWDGEYDVWYNPREDRLSFHTYHGKEFTPDLIQTALKVPIPIEKLNPYHIITINTSGILDCPIVLEKSVSNPYGDYRIFKEDDSITLSKIKKWKR